MDYRRLWLRDKDPGTANDDLDLRHGDGTEAIIQLNLADVLLDRPGTDVGFHHGAMPSDHYPVISSDGDAHGNHDAGIKLKLGKNVPPLFLDFRNAGIAMPPGGNACFGGLTGAGKPCV